MQRLYLQSGDPVAKIPAQTISDVVEILLGLEGSGGITITRNANRWIIGGGGSTADIPDGTTRYQVLSWNGLVTNDTWQADWVRAH